LGAGTFNWNVVILSTVVISLVMFVLHFVRYGHSKATDYVLVITGTKALKNAEVSQVLKDFAKETRVRSQETEGDYWEIIFEVQLKDITDTTVQDLHDRINQIPGVGKVSLLAPQIALPV
jgi:uncharacterized membrane protein YhiD involved in acid resistance